MSTPLVADFHISCIFVIDADAIQIEFDRGVPPVILCEVTTLQYERMNVDYKLIKLDSGAKSHKSPS
jgi:hypothetical protein